MTEAGCRWGVSWDLVPLYFAPSKDFVENLTLSVPTHMTSSRLSAATPAKCCGRHLVCITVTMPNASWAAGLKAAWTWTHCCR